MSEEKQDIVIPLELFEMNLTVEEVGSICILLSSPHIEKQSLDLWGKNDTLKQAINKLIKDKVIVIEEDENGNKITTIHTEKKMKKKSKNPDVNRALNEIKMEYGFDDDSLDIFQKYLDDVAFVSYTKGYDDARVDYVEPSYDGYGHKEDYV